MRTMCQQHSLNAADPLEEDDHKQSWRFYRAMLEDVQMDSETHSTPVDPPTPTFTEILAALQAGLISQADAQRQVDKLNAGATYLRDQALLASDLAPRRRTNHMWK